MRRRRLCLLGGALLGLCAAAADATPPNSTAGAVAAPLPSEAAEAALPADEEQLHSLLHWALEHADPGELQRLASAAEAADARRELPPGGAAEAVRRAWTDGELAEKRTKVKEAMDYYKSMPTEAELVKLAAAQLVNGTSESAREGALLGLLELVGPVDVANDLHTLGALEPVLEQLRAESGTLRALAAHVVGAAAANNPTVQAQVVALGGVELLLARAAHDEPDVRAKALYALSALARGPGLGRDAFLRAGGSAMLRGILVAGSDLPRLRKKALLLVTDLASARDAPAGEAGAEAGPGALVPELREPVLLQALLALLAPPAEGPPDDDLAEKVLRAMRVYVTAEAPAAAAAAEVFLRSGADSALEALRLRLAGAVAATEGDSDDGGYYADLRELRDEVAAALHAAAQPSHDEL